MKQLEVPAKAESLKAIRDFVESCAEEAGLIKAKCFKLVLAIDEIATNVVMHGNPSEDQSVILVTFSATDTRLTVTLNDWGSPFDPRQLLERETEEIHKSLDERGIGGLGILLALEGVDDFDYRYDKQKNINIFMMDLAA